MACGVARINTLQNDSFGAPACEQAYSSRHFSGAQFLLGDGSVRFVSENIEVDSDPTDSDANFLFENLLNKADGNVIGEF